MWRVTIKGLMAKKLRLVLTSISVVLGVAFMAGTFVLTDTLGSVFDDVFSQQATDIDAVVRAKQNISEDQQGGFAPRNPVPGDLVEVVEQADGAEAVQGSVFGIATVIGTDGDPVQNGGAPTFGFSWPGPGFQSLYKLQQGEEPTTPDEIALDQKTASASGYRVGDEVPMIFTQGAPSSYTLVGIFKYGSSGSLAGATLAGFEPTTAQTVMNRVDQWDEIDARAEQGVSPEELVTNIEAALKADGVAADYQVQTGQQVADETADQVKEGLSFFNTFLLVFAVIALFVGSFIIYNTFSIIVAQRSRELALLRALGASGKQVTRSVTVEALLVGLLSSVLGLILGVFVAIGLQALLSAFGFELPSKAPVIQLRTIIVSVVVGTLVTYVAALSPARRAAKVPPIAAMRDAAIVTGGGNRRYAIGGVLSVVGLVLLALGLFAGGVDGFPGGSAGLVGLAAALVFVGVAMISPLIARPVSGWLGWLPARFRGISGVLARENAMRNPRRTATTASALMIGLALITLVAVFGASAKASFSSIIDDSIRADFVVQSKGFFSTGFTPDVAAQITDAAPDAAVVELRTGTFKSAGGNTRELMGTSPDVDQAFDLQFRDGTRFDDYADGGVLLYQDTAKDLKAGVGDEITMVFERTGEQQVTVQGIYDENQAINTNYLLALSTYEENFTDQADFMVTVTAPKGEVAQTRTAIEDVLEGFPNLDVKDQAEFKAAQLAQFDTILNLLYVMLLLAVVIALIGIVNTLALSIFERTREIGLLRAVGMTRKQVKKMVRDEAVIISILGSLLGLGIGLLFGISLVTAIGSEGVTLTIPYRQLVFFVILAGLAGFLAGAWPGRKAANRDVLSSVTSE